eukprot:5548211-Pyramimonas_sp.AAC.1
MKRLGPLWGHLGRFLGWLGAPVEVILGLDWVQPGLSWGPVRLPRAPRRPFGASWVCRRGAEEGVRERA